MAEHRHRRETKARRKLRAATVAAPLALLATAGVVTVGVAAADPDSGAVLAAHDATSISAAAREVTSRDASRLVSGAERAQLEKTQQQKAMLQKAMVRNKRLVATRTAVENADERLWTTDDLNLWDGPGKAAKKVGELEAGKRVLVTGRHEDGREEVVVDGKSRWVTTGYLSDEKPVTAPAGLSMEPCPDPSVESGLTDSAVYVYRSVCHAFPQITSYGGWDNHGEHSSGRALDIMTSDYELGTAIAEYLRAHAAELNLYDVIWHQRIFTQERGGEGWRSMASRGSATADHMDHVHVSTY